MKTRCQTTRTRLKSLTLILTLAIALIIPSVQAAPGDLDTTFNAPDGFKLLAEAIFRDVAIQPGTGKILALGTSLAPDGTPESLILARYNPDGSLDSSFGAGGIASGPPMSGGNKMACQSGKIVCAGPMNDGSAQTLIARFNPDGSLDTSFGQNGFATFPGVQANGVPNIEVAIAPGGTIVLVGFKSVGDGAGKVVLARLTVDGELDTTFGNFGVVATEGGFAFDVAVLNDGHILVAGFLVHFALWRYNSNGTLDTTFAGGTGVGIADFPDPSVASSLAVQSDGRIVLAGVTEDPNANPPAPAKGAVARFNPAGNLDTSFDLDGKATATVEDSDVGFVDVALQSDGAIVAAGNVAPSSGSVTYTLVSRFTSSGSLDSSFGSGGNVVTDFPGSFQDALGVAIQTDGKIVLAGEVFSSSSDRSGLIARYNGSGAPPPPPPLSFDICLHNDSSNAGRLIFRFNSTTGAYEFRDCSKGITLTGTGTLSRQSCKLYLNDTGPGKSSDRNVAVTVNTCTRVATASITIKSLNKTYSLADNDITQGSCTCP